MKFQFDIGDTTFIALVNHKKYNAFVDRDWDLPMLKSHLIDETQKGNILVFQMTDEGMEPEWNIEIDFNQKIPKRCFRSDSGYIKVTDNALCLVEYTCLTMAAQFDDAPVPDESCDNYIFEIENGNYKVDVIQFYDADNEISYGPDDVGLKMIFTKIDKIVHTNPHIFWGTI